MSTIQEIFDKDPMNYTKDGSDVAVVVEYFRKMRLQFKLGDKNAGSVKRLESTKGSLDLKAVDLKFE